MITPCVILTLLVGVAHGNYSCDPANINQYPPFVRLIMAFNAPTEQMDKIYRIVGKGVGIWNVSPRPGSVCDGFKELFSQATEFDNIFVLSNWTSKCESPPVTRALLVYAIHNKPIGGYTLRVSRDEKLLVEENVTNVEEVARKGSLLIQQHTAFPRKKDNDENERIPMWAIIAVSIVVPFLILVIIFLALQNRQQRRDLMNLLVKGNEDSSDEHATGSSSVQSEGLLSVRVEDTKKKKEKTQEKSIDKTFDSKIAPKSDEMSLALPVSTEQFLQYMPKITAFVINYVTNPRQYPVTPNAFPGFIYQALPPVGPEVAESFDTIMKDMNNILVKGMSHWQHPQFHAFYGTGRCYPDIIAEMFIATFASVGFCWHSNPALTELEYAMVNWMGKALGIPESFLFTGTRYSDSPGGGYLADSASEAVFCALMAARNKKIDQIMTTMNIENESLPPDQQHYQVKYGVRNEICSKLVAYASTEAHSCFEKACMMSLVRCRSIRPKEYNDYGLVGEQIEREMQKDLERGLIPFYIHTVVGTTSTGAADHLESISPLGAKFNVWIHVDAAYAGNCWIDPSLRGPMKGIEHVDSINVNMHKFLLLSTGCTLFWTRDQARYKLAFTIRPIYLKNSANTNDLRDWSIQLSRRWKSLKIWFLVRMYGIQGIRSYVQRIISLTEYMEKLLCSHPNIVKFGRTHYGLFCVRYYETNMCERRRNLFTEKLCHYLNDSHQIAFTHSKVLGTDVIRVFLFYERTTKRDVEDSAAIFLRLLEEFRKQKNLHPDIDDRSMAADEFLMDGGVLGSPALSVVSVQTVGGVESTVRTAEQSASNPHLVEKNPFFAQPTVLPLPVTNIAPEKTQAAKDNSEVPISPQPTEPIEEKKTETAIKEVVTSDANQVKNDERDKKAS